MRETWNKILEFNNKYFPNWRNTAPIYYSNALAGETGEVCDGVKHLIGGGTNQQKVNLKDIAFECADVLIYNILLLESLGFSEEDFEQVFIEKMQILNQRMNMRRKLDE